MRLMADARESHEWDMTAYLAAWQANIWLPKGKQIDPAKIKPRRKPAKKTPTIFVKASEMIGMMGGPEPCSPRNSSNPSSMPKK